MYVVLPEICTGLRCPVVVRKVQSLFLPNPPVPAFVLNGSHSAAPRRSRRHSMQIKWLDTGWPEVRLCRGTRVGSFP